MIGYLLGAENHEVFLILATYLPALIHFVPANKAFVMCETPNFVWKYKSILDTAGRQKLFLSSRNGIKTSKTKLYAANLKKKRTSITWEIWRMLRIIQMSEIKCLERGIYKGKCESAKTQLMARY